MYKKEKPLSLKGSTSALYNNLSVHLAPEKEVTTYAVVHKSVVNVAGISTDGTSVNHRQVVCREPTSTHGSTIVLQAKFVPMPTRTLLVITSQMGIQIFEADNSLLLYWYALGEAKTTEIFGIEVEVLPSENNAESTFGRGICGVGDDTVCVGDYQGAIRVFNIPRSGTNITLSETLKGHNAAICSLASDGDQMVSTDDDGNICVWQVAGDSFREINRIPGARFPATTVGLWRDLVVCGYATGHLRVFSTRSGKMTAEATAHGRWITALDISKNGMVITASEDSFVRVWQLKAGDSPDLDHVFGESVTDLQLQGAQFTSEDGRSFAVTGYDNNDLIFYSQK